MYLSKLVLNVHNKAVRRDLAAPYEMHRTLMRGVDGSPAGNRLLFRLEADHPVVLVQTCEIPPDWAPLLSNGYLREARGPKPLSRCFEPGSSWPSG